MGKISRLRSAPLEMTQVEELRSARDDIRLGGTMGPGWDNSTRPHCPTAKLIGGVHFVEEGVDGLKQGVILFKFEVAQG